jgi:hypothetical protein
MKFCAGSWCAPLGKNLSGGVVHWFVGRRGQGGV